jgi:hypothetical protein
MGGIPRVMASVGGLLGPLALMLLGALIGAACRPGGDPAHVCDAFADGSGRAYLGDDEIIHVALNGEHPRALKIVAIHGGDGKELTRAFVAQDGSVSLESAGAGRFRFIANRKPSGVVQVGYQANRSNVWMDIPTDGPADLMIQEVGRAERHVLRVERDGLIRVRPHPGGADASGRPIGPIPGRPVGGASHQYCP